MAGRDMEQRRGDFLKAVYRRGGDAGRVATSELARSLGVSPASVSEMGARLAREGLLDQEPYRGVRLTRAGLEACVGLERSHTLWEVFLVERLGYTMSEAHDEAEKLEHATSPELAERLDAFLGRPASCPRGAQIPRPGARADDRELTRLSELSEGDVARVSLLEEDNELLDYVDGLGLRVGDEVTVTHVEPYEGHLGLECGGRDEHAGEGHDGRTGKGCERRPDEKHDGRPGRHVRVSHLAATRIWMSRIS